MPDLFLISILFVLFCICSFYLPGKLLLSVLNISLKYIEDIFLATSVGIVLFTLTCYLLAWFKLNFLLLPILILVSFLFLRKKLWNVQKIERNQLLALIFILLLSTIIVSTRVIFGKFADHINYTRDDYWHLALIQELKVNFPPDNPGFANLPLKGYHFFYNFLVAQVSNYSSISIFHLHFQLFPSLFTLLLTSGVYALMINWGKHIGSALTAVFLVTCGGSFTYIIWLKYHTYLSLENGMGMWQPTGWLYNPPLIVSLILITLSLFSLHQYLYSKQRRWLVPVALSLGVLPMFKVYGGIVMYGAIGLLILVESIQKRINILVATICMGIIFITTYGYFVGSSGYLIWFPLWAPHAMLNSFPWYNLEDKLYNYTKYKVIKGILRTEFDGLYIFILGNLGTRAIGLALLLYKIKWPSLFATTVLVATLISLLIPLLFIQSGKVFEIIQMTSYFLFFCALFASLGLQHFYNLKCNKLLKIILVVIFIVATIPSSLQTIINSYNNDYSKQSLEQPYFKALKFLGERGTYNDTVLELPTAEVQPSIESLRVWFNNSTPLSIGLTNKKSYISNQYIDFPGVNIDKRLTLVQQIHILAVSPDSPSEELQQKVKDFLHDNKIVYIISPHLSLNLDKLETVKQIAKYNTVAVYMVE